jgi:hypothetical protein
MIKLFILLSLFNIKLESRAQKYLGKYYDKEVFIVEQRDISNGKLYYIPNTSDILYIGKSPSRFEDFDFMVLFDKDKTIKLVKILVYREDYGGEIGSTRWLRQFIGWKEPKPFVDAISGATISVHSLKTSINTLLKEIR